MPDRPPEPSTCRDHPYLEPDSWTSHRPRPTRELKPDAAAAPRVLLRSWGPRAIFSSLRTQLISGLIFTLPIVITFWIIYWIFTTVEGFLLNPVADIINRIQA